MRGGWAPTKLFTTFAIDAAGFPTAPGPGYEMDATQGRPMWRICMAHDFASLTFRAWRNALNGLELRVWKSLLNVAQLTKPVNSSLPVGHRAFSIFVPVGQGKSRL